MSADDSHRSQIAVRGSAYVVSLPRVPGAPRVRAGPSHRHARRAAGDRGPWVSLPLRATIPEGNTVGQHADVDVGAQRQMDQSMPSLARRREQRPGEGDRRSPPPLDERPSGGDEHAQDAEVERLTPRVRGYSRSPPALSSPMCRRLMSTFPQLSTSKKMHGLMRSRESVAQNDWSGDAL